MGACSQGVNVQDCRDYFSCLGIQQGYTNKEVLHIARDRCLKLKVFMHVLLLPTPSPHTSMHWHVHCCSHAHTASHLEGCLNSDVATKNAHKSLCSSNRPRLTLLKVNSVMKELRVLSRISTLSDFSLFSIQ